MSNSTKTLNIKILDRELKVACPEEQRLQLLDAVAYLDQKMRGIRDAGKIASAERIAIMAALNITHELLIEKEKKGVDLGGYERRITAMQAAIDRELGEAETSS